MSEVSIKRVCPDGTIRSYSCDGYLHGDGDDPAVIHADGTVVYVKWGRLHRDGGQAAVIRPDGTREYWVHGRRRRDDGLPVIEPVPHPFVGEYGPQGPLVAALIERTKGVTLEEARNLAAVTPSRTGRGASEVPAWVGGAMVPPADGALGRAFHTAVADGRDAGPGQGDAMNATLNAASLQEQVASADRPVTSLAVIRRGAAYGAGMAAAGLAVRHRIGGDFTQQEYDLLTGPWRAIVGPVHPDDPDWR